MLWVIILSRWLKCFPILKDERFLLVWASTRNNRLLRGWTSVFFFQVCFPALSEGAVYCAYNLSLGFIPGSWDPTLISRNAAQDAFPFQESHPINFPRYIPVWFFSIFLGITPCFFHWGFTVVSIVNKNCVWFGCFATIILYPFLP